MIKTWLGPTVAILVALLSVASLWGSERVKVETLTENMKIQQQKVESLERRLSMYEVEAAKQREILVNINVVVKEIKDDVKALRDRK